MMTTARCACGACCSRGWGCLHADSATHVLRCLQQEKMLVEYDNARVLITDMKIEAIKDIIPLLEQVTRINLPLVIIAEDVTGAQPRGSLL